MVLYVYIYRAVVVPAEGDAHIGGNPNGVAACPVALQGVEVRSGIVHLLRPVGGFERRQDPSQLPYPLGVQALRLPLGPIVAKRLVPNATDDALKVSECGESVKCRLTSIRQVSPKRTKWLAQV